MMVFSLNLAMGLVLLSIFIAAIRLIKGPSLPDRVVAMDMMTVSIVAICGLLALRYEDTAFLDVAIALALVAFMATVALARYAERLASTGDDNPALHGKPAENHEVNHGGKP
ncbi:MAG: cation:proton antiporter [Paracoccus sp. (in: a-proteobacteria)]|nr:cation:proton antiporter [Paracoccus sp. (in: a-proteobacteria)]